MEDKNVSLYIGIASDDEDELERQEIRLRKYCQLKGYEVRKVYKDFNYSANDLSKPQFVKLQEDIKSGITEKLLVTSINHICNDLNEVFNFLDLLLTSDCGYDSIDTFDMLSYIGKTPTSLFTFF